MVLLLQRAIPLHEDGSCALVSCFRLAALLRPHDLPRIVLPLHPHLYLLERAVARKYQSYTCFFCKRVVYRRACQSSQQNDTSLNGSSPPALSSRLSRSFDASDTQSIQTEKICPLVVYYRNFTACSQLRSCALRDTHICPPTTVIIGSHRRILM